MVFGDRGTKGMVWETTGGDEVGVGGNTEGAGPSGISGYA